MNNNVSMTCPYCGVTYPLFKGTKQCNNYTEKDYYFNFDAFGLAYTGIYPDAYKLRMTRCPSEDCKKIVITLDHITNVKSLSKDQTVDNSNLVHQIMPKCITKAFPDYVPQHILADYREASSIIDLSPKGSAVLSRRCIDEIITDCFKQTKTKDTLDAKINAIENEISTNLHRALKSLKAIGNIGAHLKIQSNTILEVTKEEAQAFLWFIEYIIDEWYVQEHEKAEMIKKIAQLKK
jgi:hypothetical protein